MTSPSCPICGAPHAVCTPPVVAEPVAPIDWTPPGVPMQAKEIDMFKVTQQKPDHPEAPYTSQERLYLDADEKVVSADDPTRLTLLVPEGGTLTPEQVRKYGLMDKPEKAGEEAVQPTTPPSEVEGKEADAKEDKAVKAAPQDKAVKGPAEKK